MIVALILAAYLIGSIPFGLLVGLARGIDPRKAGSGNIGATNVARLLGGRFFALVFTLDVLKSLLPTLAAGFLLHHTYPGSALPSQAYLLWLLVGFAAILGHMFPIYLHFKGGKGVATSAGVLLGLFPYYTFPGLAAIAIWLAIFLPWRYVSLASMLGTATFPLWYLLFAILAGWDPFGRQLPLLIASLLVPTLIIYKHRGNIARLRAGTEPRIGHRPT
jgi:glycerol-3-phosphate acyltransferase PlsY